jgi:hypothetical protein
MTRRDASPDVHGGPTLALLLGWMVLYWTVRIWLESAPSMPDHKRLLLSFVPAPVFALFLWRFIKGIRGADELERRIQLESLAVAFPLGLLLLTTLGLVQRAVTLSPADWSFNHVWPMFALLYLLGLVIARRRYK